MVARQDPDPVCSKNPCRNHRRRPDDRTGQVSTCPAAGSTANASPSAVCKRFTPPARARSTSCVATERLPADGAGVAGVVAWRIASCTRGRCATASNGSAWSIAAISFTPKPIRSPRYSSFRSSASPLVKNITCARSPKGRVESHLSTASPPASGSTATITFAIPSSAGVHAGCQLFAPGMPMAGTPCAQAVMLSVSLSTRRMHPASRAAWRRSRP
jgi:hypothetical protein